MKTRFPQRSNSRAAASPALWRVMLIPVLSALLCVSIVVGSVCAWHWMEKPTSFPIEYIHVQGESPLIHVSPDLVKKIVKTQLTGGFFSLNLAAVRQSVLSHPWIETVSFRRMWPNTLSVEVVEQKPMARFGANGIVNTEGHVFYPSVKTIPQDLPELAGPVAEAQELANFFQTANTLAKLINLSVVSLRVNAIHSWYLQLNNQVLVKLGRQDALVRFKRFVAIYPKIALTSKLPISSVDLRYPDGVAVQFGAVSKSPTKSPIS